MTYIVLTDNNCLPIEPTINKRSGNVLKPEVIDAFDDECVFIVNKQNKHIYEGLPTIGDSPDCMMSIVTDDNIHSYIGTRMQNAMMIVKDINKLFQNFEIIALQVNGYIDIKVPVDADIDSLNKEVGKIADFIMKSEVHVKNLNAYSGAKFSPFGQDSVFVDPNGGIYYHPSFYYDGCDPISHVGKFGKDFHFTKPHLICATCETFYCDRDLFHNKLRTGEYMVPCEANCKVTSVFANHARRLFNALSQSSLPESLNLGDIETFDAESEYEKLLHDSVLCNQIKNINFSDRYLGKI